MNDEKRNRENKYLSKMLEKGSGTSINLKKEKKAVYLLLDCSSSMGGGNKMDQAKNGCIGFANEALRKDYRIGLIKFDSTAEHLLFPTIEMKYLSNQLDNLTLGGSTNMAHAFELAIEELTRLDVIGERVICVVTDGIPDDRSSVLKLSNEAQSKAIDIMSIGTDDADELFLKELATRSGLSLKVNHEKLADGIVSMAKLLPGGK